MKERSEISRAFRDIESSMHKCMLHCIHYSKKASAFIDERSIGDGIIALPECSAARGRLLRKPVINNSANGGNTVSTLLCNLFKSETLNDPFFEPSKVSSMFVTCIGP